MVTLALVGKGRWGANYIRTIEKIRDCSLPQENIVSHNYSTLFKRKNIDGVIIATPASTHFQIAKEFITNGFNVLIEKPVALRVSQVKTLQKLKKKHKVVIMIGHIYLYNPAFITFKAYAQKIKNIQFVHSEGMNYGPFRTDVSALWDWAPHDISMCLELFKKPLSVSAWRTSTSQERNIEMCIIKLNYKDFSVISSIGCLSPIKKRTFIVSNKKSTVIFDDTSLKKVELINHAKLTRSYPKYSGTSPLKNQILEFMSAIKTHRNTRTNINEGILVTKIIAAAEKSAYKNGREIAIKI